jgi:excisionase family DNA binding protein
VSNKPTDRVSKAEAAALAGTSVRTIERAVAAGELKVEREDNGRRVSINRADLVQWIGKRGLRVCNLSEPSLASLLDMALQLIGSRESGAAE